MRTYATIIALVLLLPMTGFSQESKDAFSRTALSSPKPEKHKTTVNEPTEKITHVSSNTLSLTLTVHTYKLVGSSVSNDNDVDQQPAESNNEEIQNIIEAFSETEGVSRCTYDHATTTFTILSKPDTDLSATVNSLNQ